MLNLNDILLATGGRQLSGKRHALIRSVSTDSRTLKRGDLFIALCGKNFDGHNFLRKVIARSAAAIIVSKKVSLPHTDIPIIFVDDTTQALGQIARFHRRRFKIPVIAITGSAGKTTTKEMIAAVLEKKYKVLKNIATLNNNIGVPMTLLKLNKTHKIVVVELGTNHFGEIAQLAQIAEPTVSLLTNIGESHLEFLKTPAGVFKEKFNIIRRMQENGLVIFNKDDRFLRTIPNKAKGKEFISFGIKSQSDIKAGNIQEPDSGSLCFTVNDRQKFCLQVFGSHNVYNALAAISCGRLFKVNDQKIKEALLEFKNLYGRGVFKKVKSWNILDDSYNANPMSLRSSIETLSRLKTKGRKILVCGDMLELGSKSEQLHRKIGKLVGRSNIDSIITLGNLSKFISLEAKKQNKNLKSYHCHRIEHVHKILKSDLNSGDVILIKGSRGLRMERVIALLKGKEEN
ncbi:MAG: UDP-N-acetylmuramoyl-tripeptide--D-alanyl-D-alanine ligase [Candidatus Omnitrophota bacterium]